MDDHSPEARDDRVLELRTERKSYVAIARLLELDRASDAVAAFNRALRRRPDDEQERLRQAELARLDRMQENLRKKDGLSSADLTRRMRVVQRLRTQLLAP
jgi:hypothetical protein